MKVSFVFARVEVGRVQRRYNVQRETLIRAGICEVRCMCKTELHLNPQSYSSPERFQRAVVPSSWKPTEPHISFRRTPHLKRRRNRADTEPFSPVRLSERGASHQVFSRCP